MEPEYSSILTSLRNYQERVLKSSHALSLDEQLAEKDVIAGFYKFLKSTEDVFSRHNRSGHITGSAFVVDAQYNRLVLTHHAKLHKWVQLGGHADEDKKIDQVALREAREESGLKQLELLSPELEPLDFSIHEVPATPKFPAHLHYDISYVIVAHDDVLVCSEESIEVRWFTLGEAFQVCESEMHPRLHKLEAFLAERRQARKIS